MEARIRANADLVIRELGQLRETPLGYDAESVAWLDGYIERQRARRDLTIEAINRMVDVLGSFLGECIIHCFGGRWHCEGGQWWVAFGEDNAVYPFNKVRKQFANGAEDSIKAFFDTAGVVFAQPKVE